MRAGLASVPFAALAGTLLVGACGSVPDLHFDDGDAGGDGGSGPASDGSFDSGSGRDGDASGTGDAGDAGMCTPPSPMGVCCGSIPCTRCSMADCATCTTTC